MLYSFGVSNYRSIQDALLPLSWPGKRVPAHYSDYPSVLFVEDGKRRAVPLVVIYGANSSGKSTLLSALKDYVSLMREGIGKVKYTPDRFLSVDGTTFRAEVVVRGRLYSHSITFNKSEILSESLKEEDESVLLIENGNLKKGSASFQSCLDEKGRQILSVVTSMMGDSFASALGEGTVFFNPFSYSVSDCFSHYVSISGKTREECLKNITALARKLDLTIDDIRDGDEWQTEHTDSKKREIWFSLEEESEGTKRLFALLSVILSSLSSGGILVIDEIDTSLHSIVLRQLVSLFLDKRYNTTGAQLVCSSHNTDLLDAPFIQKCEIAFFEKTKKNGSVVARLSEIEGVRSLSSFRTDYLEGRFSGIPFPYI